MFLYVVRSGFVQMNFSGTKPVEFRMNFLQTGRIKCGEQVIGLGNYLQTEGKECRNSKTK